MASWLRMLAGSESGSSTLEYALIAAVIAALLPAGVYWFGDDVVSALTEIRSQIEAAGATGSSPVISVRPD